MSPYFKSGQRFRFRNAFVKVPDYLVTLLHTFICSLSRNGGKFFTVNAGNVQAFVRKAAHEVAKKKTGNDKLPDNATEVDDMEEKIKACICAQGPVIAGTVCI